MSFSEFPRRPIGMMLASGAVLFGFTLSLQGAGVYGRLFGTVTDGQGNPLMGATIGVAPAAIGSVGVNQLIEQVITDAHGKFAIERLAPGLYSLRVTSPTRVPALRSRISIKGGQTTQQDFVLSGILSPVRIQLPKGSASRWGDDWKWVLRTSESTRPVLRYRDAKPTRTQASKRHQAPDQRLIGIVPGPPRRETLAGDSGPGSVLAYLRPLSPDSDLLVAGSMTASGLLGSSLATAFRKNLVSGDPQTLALVVHQLSVAEGVPIISGAPGQTPARGQGVAVSYSHTRRLASSLNFTAGFEADYLNAWHDVLIARPSMQIEYRATPSSVVTFRYGLSGTRSDDTLLERIGVLNAFPRITLRGGRPQLENLNHAAIDVTQRIGKVSHAEVTVFRDSFQNAAVLASGGPDSLQAWAGSFLPNRGIRGGILNAGNYGSSGVRMVYSRRIGSCVETSVTYALGSALIATPMDLGPDPRNDLASFLRAGRSQSVAGKVAARLPVSRTQVVASYEWLQPGRVTTVDPFGEAALQLQPYLGMLIRQPLPALAFFPAHIEAQADFRNLLAQGYVPASRAGRRGEPLMMTSGYRSFRGGFSVQF